MPVFAILAAMVATPSIGADEYMLDSGFGSDSMLVDAPATPPPISVVVVNAFTVRPGFETITGVGAAFGRAASRLGRPVNVLLYLDGDAEPSPGGSSLLSITPATISVIDTAGVIDERQHVSIPPVTLAVGARFFVGLQFPDAAHGQELLGVTSGLHARPGGWAYFGSPGELPGAPSSELFNLFLYGPEVTPMISADAVPGPATALVFPPIALAATRTTIRRARDSAHAR